MHLTFQEALLMLFHKECLQHVLYHRVKFYVQYSASNILLNMDDEEFLPHMANQHPPKTVR